MSKIYTKKGDKGITKLYDMTSLPKSSCQIDSIGDLDELNSYIGLVIFHINDELAKNEGWVRYDNLYYVKQILTKVQKSLFSVGSVAGKYNRDLISEDDVTELEQHIDYMTSFLPRLKNFILPGGSLISSHVHVSRAICRRAERHISSTDVPPIINKYMNRLSDFLFTIARYVNLIKGEEEVIFSPASSESETNSSIDSINQQVKDLSFGDLAQLHMK